MNDIAALVDGENNVLSELGLRLENEILRDSLGNILLNAAPVIGTVNFPCPEQWPSELEWFLTKYVRHCRSVLEIGSGPGGMFAHLVTNIEKGSVARAISLPRFQPEADSLRLCIAQLRAWDFNVGWFNGDSSSAEAMAWAKAAGPYDLVFIDGDHTAEAVRLDWENYSPMATKFVAFHDIDHIGDDVGVVWAELKSEGYVTDEIISHPGFRGLGVVLR
jgi:hypothetical protein